MLSISAGGGNLAVVCDGRQLIRHSGTQPFASAVRKEKTYRLSHGNAKAAEKVLEDIPLAAFSVDGNRVVFSGGGHRLEVDFVERAGGFVACLRGEPGWGYRFSLCAQRREAIFGGGEQYRKLNLKGERVVNFVSEHITVPTVLQKAVLPPALYREKTHAQIGAYSPMPVFVSSEKYLLRFETTADGFSDFRPTESVFSFDSCPKSLTYLTADSFSALSRALADVTPNRQYLPGWCLDGMILGVQGGTETVLKKAFAMQDAGARVCGVWCQDWCGERITAMGKQVNWNWEGDDALYPGLRDAVARLRARGIEFLAYINPYLVKDGPQYNFCKEKGWLITKTDGSVCHMKSTTFDAGMLDLTNPDAVTYIKDTLIKENMLSLGIRGYMADFGEYLPPDAVLHDGSAQELHNAWPVLWAKLNREAIEEFGDPEVFFFTRSGYLGVQSYAPCMWNGDQHVDYSRDYGLPCVMPASFSLGFSGVTTVHSDIGGFFTVGRMKRDGELFVRWMEMNAFTPLMRSHESLRPDKNAQFDTDFTKPYTVALTRLHAKLRPYFEAVLAEAKGGVPALRPDFYNAGDYSAHRDEYAFFTGSDLFVAPVLAPGAATRRVFLPDGEWVHFFTGEVISGGEHLINAPLGQPPVFYRADSSYSELFKTAAAEYGN